MVYSEYNILLQGGISGNILENMYRKVEIIRTDNLCQLFCTS